MAFLDFLDQVAIQGGEEVKRQRQRRETMDDLVTLEQAKAQLDPKTQAMEQARKLAQTLGIEPKPLGGYNTEEIARGIPQQVQQTAATKELEALQRFGVLPQPASATMVSPIIFDPNTGQYQTMQGEAVTSVPRGTPVRNKPLSTQTLEDQAEARTRGGIAGNPVKKAAVQNLKDIQSGLQRVDKILASDPGFQGKLFRTGIPFQPGGAGTLHDELKNIGDILLRARSGASINEKEYQRLSNLLPRSMDAISEVFGNPGRAREKLVKFQTAMDEILSTGTPATLQDESEEAEGSATERSGGQVMEDAQGNRAIVYPDGTIEELP